MSENEKTGDDRSGNDRSGVDQVFCKRARVWGPPPQNVPWGGALGEEIRNNVCESTWKEWLGMEVMVINELRLNFMDPKSQDVLIGHMREFLCLDQDVEPTPRPE